MTSSSLQRWSAAHRWTSLLCMANLFVLALSGLPLIFHDEIEAALGTIPRAAANGTRLPLERLVQSVRETYPGWSPMTYVGDEEHPGLAFLAVCPPGTRDFEKAKRLLINTSTGEIEKIDLDHTWTAWLLKLHTKLFAGFFGEMYLAVVGVGFFLSLLSGAVLYGPFMREILFATLRRKRGQRIYQLDLHNLIGAAIFGWCSVVALTGVILELEKPILAYYQRAGLAAMIAPWKGLPAPAKIVPLEKAAAAAEAAWPKHHIKFALFPGTPYSGEHHFTFFMAYDTGIASRVLKIALVDAETGQLSVSRESPWYIKALFISGPLHFGDYAGLPLKILWTVFTLCTLVLCGSGFWLTILRWQRRSSALPMAALQEVAS